MPENPEDPYLTKNKKVIWHHRDQPFKCHEYDIKKKKTTEYTISSDAYFCANPNEAESTLNDAIHWGNDWAWDHRMISVDGKQSIATCIDGDDSVLCLKTMTTREEKSLVRCKGCEAYNKNSFGMSVYFYNLDWSTNGRFLLFNFKERIYLYDFEARKAGYLVDGQVAKFYNVGQ